MPVPTPIRVRRSPSMPSRRPTPQAATSASDRVPSITGSDDNPVWATSASDSPDPSTTIASCSTVRLEKATPGCSRMSSDRLRSTTPSATPNTIPQTGAPITGTSRPTTVASAAMPAQTANPGRRAKPGTVCDGLDSSCGSEWLTRHPPG